MILKFLRISAIRPYFDGKRTRTNQSTRCVARTVRFVLIMPPGHTKAMHLLQSGVPIHVIQNILGHSDIMTTERYAHADLAMKQKALESAKPLKAPPPSEMDFLDEPDLIEWLNSYARECTEKII